MSYTTKRTSLLTPQGEKLSWDYGGTAKDRKMKQESPDASPPRRLGADVKRSAGKLENNTIKKPRLEASFGAPRSIPNTGSGGQLAPGQQRAPTPAAKAKTAPVFFIESSDDEDDEDDKSKNYTSAKPEASAPPATPRPAAPSTYFEAEPSKEEQRLASKRMRAEAQERKQRSQAANTPAPPPAPTSARRPVRTQASASIDLTSDDESSSRSKPPTLSKALPPSAIAPRPAQQAKSSNTLQKAQELPRKKLGGSLFSDGQASATTTKSALAAPTRQQTPATQGKALPKGKPSISKESVLSSQPQHRTQIQQDNGQRNQKVVASRRDSLEPSRPITISDTQCKSNANGSATAVAKNGSRPHGQQSLEAQQRASIITKKSPPAPMPFEIPTNTAEPPITDPTGPRINGAVDKLPPDPDPLDGRLEAAKKEAEKAERLQELRAARKLEHERRRLQEEQAEKLQAQEEARRRVEQQQQERARIEREAEERRRREADMAEQLKLEQQHKAEQAEKRKAAAALLPKPPPVVDPKVAEEERRRQERIRKQEERIAKRKEEDAEDERLAAELSSELPQGSQSFGLPTPSSSFPSSIGNKSSSSHGNGPKSLRTLSSQGGPMFRGQDSSQEKVSSNAPKDPRDRSVLPKDSEITQADAQLLHWKAQPDMVWTDILDLYAGATNKKLSDHTVKRRHAQLKKSIEAAGVSSDLMENLRRGDIVAKRQVNLKVHGQDIVVEPDVTVEEPLTIKLGPRPTQPRRTQEPFAPQTVPPTQPSVEPSAQAERPDKGGKSIDFNLFLQTFEGLHKSLEEDRIEEANEDVYYPGNDDDEYEGHFVYRIYRQRLSADDIAAIEDDPDYQQQIEGVEECKDCYSLEEANAEAELEAVRIRKTDPRWMTGRRLTDTDYDEHGMACHRARHQDLGGVDVWVDRILVQSDDPVAVVATIPKYTYAIIQRTTTHPPPADEDDLFAEPPQPSIRETLANNKTTLTTLGSANYRAIEIFVDLTYKSDTTNMHMRDLEKQELIAGLSNSLVGDDMFHRREELEDGRKVVEVMVEKWRNQGPRNL